MPFREFCYLGQNEKVISHLAMTKWLQKQQRIRSKFKFSPPLPPRKASERKPAVSFQSICGDRSFLFHMPLILIIPILRILIPKQTKKTRPKQIFHH